MPEGPMLTGPGDFGMRSMDDSPQGQVDTYLSRLDGLIRRGRQMRDALAKDPSNAATIAATRMWQEQCGVTINQLSGGSKAHWLARSFSEAFLMRSASGYVVEGAAPAEIVQRLLDVLQKAVASLSQKDDAPVLAASSESALRRFDFVHDPDLRPVVEQAYVDGRRALEQGDYDLALRTSCGILEAIVTDALEHKGLSVLVVLGRPAGKIADWPFEVRLAVAEKAGIIRGGWVRLPESARKYRDHDGGVSDAAICEGDARRTGQVLNVVMRDLNPGR